MKIRKYKPCELEQVVELFQSNTPHYFDPSEEADLKIYLEEQTEDYFVVELGGEIIGAGGINYMPEDHAACISWDFIKPKQQGKGIGRKLVEFRIEHLKNMPEINTVVVRTSQHTNKFYEKMGFNLIQIKKDYWAKGFDLYEMGMRL